MLHIICKSCKSLLTQNFVLDPKLWTLDLCSTFETVNPSEIIHNSHAIFNSLIFNVWFTYKDVWHIRYVVLLYCHVFSTGHSFGSSRFLQGVTLLHLMLSTWEFWRFSHGLEIRLFSGRPFWFISFFIFGFGVWQILKLF